MESFDGVPRRRFNEKDTNEPEILDRDEQERVIQDLQNDYLNLIKSQRKGFITFVLLMACFCFAGLAITKNYVTFLSAAFAFLSTLLLEILNSGFRWVIVGVFEALAVICSAIDDSPLKIRIAVHAIFAIVIMLYVSMEKSSKSLPQEINKLKDLKYGPKLA